MSTPPRVLLFFVVGLVAASQSGNIIRLGAASPAAISAWRLLLAVLLVAPLIGGEWRALRGLSRRSWGLLLLTGLVLCAHFYTWIAAIQQTTVANAASVLALGPVVTALGSWWLLGEVIGWRFVFALGVGGAGVAVIGLGDLTLDPAQLTGDGLAVLSMLCFAAYLLLGRRLRAELPNGAYVGVVYSVAALASFALLIGQGQPLLRYDARTWLCFVGMALVPTVLGHTAINSALRYLPAGRVALATVSEPPLAGLVAWLAWSEPLTWFAVLGYGLVTAAVVLMVWDQGRARRVAQGR